MTTQKTPPRLVCFAHGKESGPWGTKITHLAEIARRRGYDVMSPDYSHTHDPRVLAGSSMGGYVSAMACTALKPRALFLMAPALYFPGWDEEPTDIPKPCCVVHGWNDDVVDHRRGLDFADRHRAELHLLDSGHTLSDQLPALALLFGDLLDRARTA
jgi:alpha/beta superfamily hydrolase